MRRLDLVGLDTVVRLVAWLLALATLPGLASGEELQVTLRDADGRPVVGQRLWLEFATSEERPFEGMASAVVVRGRSAFPTTDNEGRAVFPGLEGGTYVVRVSPSSTSDLVPPRDNPLVASPRVTLDAERPGVRQLDIQLVRGVRTRVFLDLPVQKFSGFEVFFRHRETGFLLRSPFFPDHPSLERLLVPGLWEVSMAPKPGFLLVGLQRDRLDVDGNAVFLDLATSPQSVDLTWIYSAPCSVHGAVTEVSGQEPQVVIEATLVEPGPWIEAARRRGGSLVDRVTAVVDSRTGDYEMVLPDGSWQLRPVGDLVLESVPEVHSLKLAPGDDAEVNFTIRQDESAGQGQSVWVVDGHDVPVRGARVAVFPLGDDEAPPLATGVTGRDGHARLAGLGDGDHLLVASHPSYLEAQRELRGYQADNPPHPPPEIALGQGGELHFTVVDQHGEPAVGVALEVERQGDPPPVRLVEAELASARDLRTAVTDRAGRALLQGFYPGDYVIRGSPGRGKATLGALLRLGPPGGRLEPTYAVTLEAKGRLEIEGRLLPSATLRARVGCGDGSRIPDVVSVRVIEATTPLPNDPTGRASPPGEPVLGIDRLVLTGPARDEVEIGPLPAGDYRLALRPATFERWTWAFETHDPEESQEIAVRLNTGSEPLVDLGELLVECGPAIDVVPGVVGEGRVPSLDEIRVEAWLLEPDEDFERSDPPWIARRRGRFEIRGLVAGEGRFLVALTHPHFLPEPTLDWEVPVELERGNLVELTPGIPLGGALELPVTELRSWPTHGPATLQLVAESMDGGVHVSGEVVGAGAEARLQVPSLPSGAYRVWLEPLAGGEPLRQWSEVVVEVGTTRRLRAEP